MANSSNNSEYDFAIDSTFEQDLHDEDFWELYLFEWYHRNDFGLDCDFAEDRLEERRPYFQILAYMELIIVIVHLTYQKGG